MVRAWIVSCIIVLGLGVVAGCGSDKPQGRARYDGPPTVTLSSDGATVTLALREFGMRVAAPDGRTVLSTYDGDRSVANDAARAYGPLGAAHRDVTSKPALLEGYEHADRVDAQWLHGSAVAAVRADATSADVDLFDPAAPDVTFMVRIEVAGPEVAVAMTARDDRKDAAPFTVAGQSFRLQDGEHVVGLGERENAIERRGGTYRCWTEEGGIGGGEQAAAGPANPSPNGPDMTHVPIPFYISSKGYGLWLDSTARSAFAVGSDDPSLLRLETETPTLAYRVFVRDDPKDALADFTARVGRARLPAPWVFGPRRRMDMQTTVDGVPEHQALRERGVPTSVADDTTHFLPNAGQAGREADLKAWTDTLHRKGFKAMGYFNAHVSVTKPDAAGMLADARARDLLVKRDDGTEFDTFMISGGAQQVATLDLTKPEAVDWFRGKMDDALALGYDGWMLDFGEYLPREAKLANGMTGAEAHNLFPLLQQRATFDHLRDVRGDDFLIYVRSGAAGTQSSTVVVWSGDPSASFDDARGLPAMVRAGLNAGLSGIPFWGSDVSGFTCFNDPPADKEVYLRWAEFGALSSDMHDDNACAGARDGAKKWTLWSDAETTSVYGDYARLHTRLFPYLYAAAKDATETGMPVMRHPLLMHPGEPDAWNAVHEYWFGPALYVAPVVRRGQTSRTAWLPPGTWFDWWTLAPTRGGTTVTRDAPLATLPLWQRAGSIVAMLDRDVQTLVPTDDPSIVDLAHRADVLDVRVALDRNANAAVASLVDGTALSATLLPGDAAVPSDVAAAPDDATLATCARCGRIDPLPGGALRVRVTATGDVRAGALALSSPRRDLRVRWEALLLP